MKILRMKASYILKYYYQAKFTWSSEKWENIRNGHREQNLFEGKGLFANISIWKIGLKNEIDDDNEK